MLTKELDEKQMQLFTNSWSWYLVDNVLISVLCWSNLTVSDVYPLCFSLISTSRDRPKSAPYPRLKNTKKTSKCQVFSITVLENRKFFEKNFRNKHILTKMKKMDRVARRGPLAQAPGALKSHNAENWKKDPLKFFNIHSVAKHEKTWENKNFYFREKISQCQKKLKGGTLWDFSTSILSQNIKQMQGDPLRKKNFRKKSLAVPKKWKGGYGMVCYPEKQEKPFWFSSLGQIVQFGAIIFCRTFKNYFGQFVRIEKKESS